MSNTQTDIRTTFGVVGLYLFFGPFAFASLAAESLLDHLRGPDRRQRLSSFQGWLSRISRGWCTGVLVGAACLLPILLVLPPEFVLANHTPLSLSILLAANIGALVSFYTR